MKTLLARLLVWCLGADKVDQHLMNVRAEKQHRLAANLIADKYISWQAEMVLRHERTEKDIHRRLELQNLALALIYNEMGRRTEAVGKVQ